MNSKGQRLFRNDSINSFGDVQLGRDVPLRFIANPTSRSFGDFAMQLFAINTMVDQFDKWALTLLYRDDRDYKQGLLRLMLPTPVLLGFPAGMLMPSIDIMNGDAMSEGAGIVDHFGEAARPWFESGQHTSDLFITDFMASARAFCNFDRLAYLRFPDEDVGPLTDQLVARGLKPDRWFVTVHCREPGYEGKPQGFNLRDQDPRAFLPAMDHIIGALGGQVVRLGHPSMTPLVPREGLVDLSRDIGNATLQTFAISRSRFLLCGPSGPNGVANCFHVPIAQVNATDIGPENDRLVVKTVKIVTPEDGKLQQADLFAAGYSKRVILHKLKRNEPIRVFFSHSDEVTRCARFVHDQTQDCTGWREPDPVDQRPRPNQIVWPGHTRMRGMFLPDDYK